MKLHSKEVRNTICLEKVLRVEFHVQNSFSFPQKKSWQTTVSCQKIFFQEKVGKQRFFASFWQTRDWQTTVHDLYMF